MHDAATELTEPFDAERAVEMYRRVIALRDASTDLGRMEFQAITQRLHDSWKNWQGEDSLHEMAFGEPED